MQLNIKARFLLYIIILIGNIFSSTNKAFHLHCSVKGYRGLVERHLEVEVSGFGRDGSPIIIDACGWKARILQHECDHIQGHLFVDKMVPRTFRTTANLQLVLPSGCPKIGEYEDKTNQ
jgi:peptide deformylase